MPFGIEGPRATQWQAQGWWRGTPVLTLPPPNTHLVVLAAHPDDETLGVGGLLHAASQRQLPITVLIASDGEASHPNSPSHQPGELSRIRQRETAAAMDVLAPAATLRHLHLPDGHLTEHQPALVDALEQAVGIDTDTWLLSTWLDDGHPDHAAAARAARMVAAHRSATRLFEYPIWFWHLADPEDSPPAFVNVVHRFDLTPSDRRARADALAQYPSQTHPLSDQPGDEAVLPGRFLAHFDRDCDFLLPMTITGRNSDPGGQ
ncbi:N-acetylglucosaminyl deacetylase, LmbE family [Frankineae bacterium MT45]|nr:N-acetylglucosaminyl deacetylase, LmbE family [Frankineae bacterium MT45]